MEKKARSDALRGGAKAAVPSWLGRRGEGIPLRRINLGRGFNRGEQSSVSVCSVRGYARTPAPRRAAPRRDERSRAEPSGSEGSRKVPSGAGVGQARSALCGLREASSPGPARRGAAAAGGAGPQRCSAGAGVEWSGVGWGGLRGEAARLPARLPLIQPESQQHPPECASSFDYPPESDNSH